jgi:predicted transcriptional regulator
VFIRVSINSQFIDFTQLHIQRTYKGFMKNTNITVRIDDELKQKLETACQYLGLTITAVFNKAARQTLDEYYKQMSNDTKIAREIADGDNYQFMYEAALRESAILKSLGFDTVTALFTGAEKTKILAFKEFLELENCKALNIPYVPLKERLEIIINHVLNAKTVTDQAQTIEQRNDD